MSNTKSNFPAAQKPGIPVEQMKQQVDDLNELRKLGRKPYDRSDPKALDERIDAYFIWCTQYGFKPSVEGLCLALNVSRQALWKIEQEDNKRGEAVRGAKQLMSALLEAWQLDGAVKETTAIWLQKNYYGFRDQLDIAAIPAPKQLDSLPGKAEITRRLPSGNIVDEDVDLSELFDN
jgi:hypothetical protein